MRSLKTPLAIVSCDKEIIELAVEQKKYQLIGCFDSNPKADALGFKVLGGDDAWPTVRKKYPGLKIVVSLDPGAKKERVAHQYGLKSLVSLISREAFVSPSARIKDGAIVQRGVSIMAKASLGVACKVNVNAVVHHDCLIGDFCTLAPGAQILGAVTIGNNVFIGAGAIVLPKLKIGDGVIVGAGSVVTKNISAGQTVAGVPAKSI